MRLPGHTEPWWMLTRASGIAAIVVVLAATTFGVLLVARRSGSSVRGQTRLHRRLSGLGLGLIALHIAAALLDRHHVPPYAVVAPFVSPTRRLAAGTGSLATWGLVLVAATATARRARKLAWRTVHLVAYPAALFAVVHSLLGSDSSALRFWLGLWTGALVVAAVPATRARWLLRQRHEGADTTATAAPVAPTAAAAGPTWAAPARAPGHRALPGPVYTPAAGRRPTHLEADRSLTEALAKLADAQRLLAEFRDHQDEHPTAATAPGGTSPSVAAEVAAPRSAPIVATVLEGPRHVHATNGRSGAAGHSALLVPPSVWDITRRVLLERGVRVSPDVARRTAQHLMGQGPNVPPTRAEFRLADANGQQRTVVITTQELTEAVEGARAWQPRFTPVPEVATA